MVRGDRVRLLGVDTPETNGQNEPYEYDAVTDTACLDDWGNRATEFAVDELLGQSVKLLLDPMAGRRGSYDRLLAYILAGGQDFGSLLLVLGYGRVYEEGDSSWEQNYLRLQDEAQAKGRGLWDVRSVQVQR